MSFSFLKPFRSRLITLNTFAGSDAGLDMAFHFAPVGKAGERILRGNVLHFLELRFVRGDLSAQLRDGSVAVLHHLRHIALEIRGVLAQGLPDGGHVVELGCGLKALGEFREPLGVALVAFPHLLGGHAGHQEHVLHLLGALLKEPEGILGPGFQSVLDRLRDSGYFHFGNRVCQRRTQVLQSGLQVFARGGAGLRSGFTDGVQSRMIRIQGRTE